MDTEGLRRLYTENPAVKAICDEMSTRERNQTETKLKRILARLGKNGTDIRRHEAIAAFRLLEDCGCGQYIEGRHGWPSRFVWSVGSIAACQVAQGSNADIKSLPEADEEEEVDAELDTVTHVLRLREDFDLELQLPTDFSRREARRVVNFVNALPIDE